MLRSEVQSLIQALGVVAKWTNALDLSSNPPGSQVRILPTLLRSHSSVGRAECLYFYVVTLRPRVQSPLRPF